MPEQTDVPSGEAVGVPRAPDLLAGQHFPPPPRQERSRQKRAALLSAGLALFGERGYEETSIEQIAQRAGVAVGGFYQHFASKRQLLLVLMDQLLHEIGTLLVGADDGAAIATEPVRPDVRMLIEALVRSGLQLDWSYAGAYRAWSEASVIDPELRALHARVEEWTAGWLAFLLGQLAQLPGARRDVDIATLASVLSALFWRLAQTPLDHPDATIASVTDLILHALFTDAAT